MTRHGDIDFERRTALVGVLNVTPDSFSDGGRYLDPENAIARGVKLAEEGADLIDIGGESSRPGARPVSAEEELERVVPVIRGLRRALSVPLSIDTYKARVARVALEEGVDVVNDISAMRFDPEMVRVIAAAKVPVVLMHMQGTPRTMQERPYYRDVVEEVKGFLQERIEFALESGVGPEQILVDPGIGFGKELEHNLALLRGLPALASLGRPILVGPSRKTFIGKILGVGPEERLEGSLAAAVAAVLAGANMIRIHDVREARRAIGIADALRYGSVHG
ncbi:MAG: dihydropteroate synthase [Deltaproteobacteria bacterium GWA2_57_13]|nr:MAG: dihydropteroate synthase [Deltaproteobacteria bacterium GWA2_57_13]